MVGMVYNKPHHPDRVWIGGCYKKDIQKAGIKDIISKQDWGNWIFSIPRKEAHKLGINLKGE